MTTPLTAWPGTISIAANGTAITGTGAALSTANKGALIIVDGLVGQLADDPTDDNTATLLEAISASAITDAPYVLVPISGAVVQAQRVRQLIETLAITKPGIPLTMDATTTLGDPGAGKVRFNSATNPTVACISYTDNLGNSCKARVQALDDSVNAVARSVLEFLPTDDANAYLDLDVTGAITDETTYAQVPVGLRSGAVPADKAALAMVGVSAGKDGAAGTNGANGVLSAGSAGTTDNALLRADGTAGNKVQSSPVVVDDSGNVSGLLSLDISSASGGQIKFPSTQNPSADANTLDDYEEGTYTPTISSSSGSSTAGTTSGRYTKIGQLWVVAANAIMTAVGTGSGFVQISLPSTPANLSSGFGFESAHTAKMLTAFTASNLMKIAFYDGTYPGLNTGSYSASISYT